MNCLLNSQMSLSKAIKHHASADPSLRSFRFDLTARLFLICALLLISTGLSAQTDSCTIQWGGVTQISHSDCPQVVPQILAVGDTIHLLWYSAYATSCDTTSRGIFYSHSFDGGHRFSQPLRLQSDLKANGGQGLLAAFGKYIYMAYYQRNDPYVYPWQWIAVQRSTDAGVTWQLPQLLINDRNLRGLAAYDSSVYVRFLYADSSRRPQNGLVGSRDYGATFDTISLGLAAASPNGASPMDQFIATSRGLHLIYEEPIGVGAIYSYEIFYTRSTDNGYTWSLPDTLTAMDSSHSTHPRIAGDEQGNLYVVWYDFKYGSIDGYHGSVILRKSTDNGLSWGNEVLLTSAPTAINPAIAINKNYVVIGLNEFVDYNHDRSLIRVSSDNGNTWCDTISVNGLAGGIEIAPVNELIHCLWVQYDYELYYRDGLFPRQNPKFPMENVLLNCYPNPFNSGTVIPYELSERSRVNLDVYDLLGRRVVTLTRDEMKDPGRYDVHFDASSLASGVYFYRLQTEFYQGIKKLILIK